jgi:hypothetical protein
MDKQMVTGHNPQADAQKTASTKGTDGEKGQAGSEALSLIKDEFSWITPEIAERLTRPIKWDYKLPEVSGFKMARLVCLLTFLSLSCSYNLSPTTAQKEQKKFERFKIAPKEAIILSGAAFIGYGTGKHFNRTKE